MLCWAHLNGRMMDAHRDILFSRAAPEELYISMGTCGYVSYLWPIVSRTIGHATLFDYMTGNITTSCSTLRIGSVCPRKQFLHCTSAYRRGEK